MSKATKARELKLKNERLRGELTELRGYHADYESRMKGEVAHFWCLVEGAKSRAAEADAMCQSLESDLIAKAEE